MCQQNLTCILRIQNYLLSFIECQLTLALAHLIWYRDTDKGIARAPSTQQTINSTTWSLFLQSLGATHVR